MSIRFEKLSKSDIDYGRTFKFVTNEGGKYAISKHPSENKYMFWGAENTSKSRFNLIAVFDTEEEAKNFIYTDKCPLWWEIKNGI